MSTRRDFLSRAGAIAAAASVGSLLRANAVQAQGADLYGYAQMYGAGYADPLTVTSQTESLRVWVQSGKTYAFRIARVSVATSSLFRESPVYEGIAPVLASSEPARGLWNSYASFATTNWPDGLYVIDIGPDEVLSPINTSTASALFVIRRGISASKILYKLPTNTWNAYSKMPWIPIGAPGYGDHGESLRSFYDGRHTWESSVPYHRPGLGINGDGIANWVISLETAPTAHRLIEGHDTFIPWLVASFGDIDFCTDLDLHHTAAQEMLRRYRLLICSAHDEYWTTSMRAHVASHVNQSGNVAFLSGNNLYWKADIEELISSSPPSTLFTLKVNKQVANYVKGNWPTDEARLTGMSGRGGGGWMTELEQAAPPLVFDVSVSQSWIRHEVASMQLPAGGGRLIGYEFDNVHATTPADHVRAATTGPVIEGQNGANYICTVNGEPKNYDCPGTGMSAALCYFQPFGGVVNVGTTEWIKFVVSDTPGVGQVTKNIVRTLSGDRRFVSVGSLSRPVGFDILYFNQIELPGETVSSCISGFWMLDSLGQSASVERGKWLSARQVASGFTPRAFGRNLAGASRVYHQNDLGEVSVWDITMTSSDSEVLRPLVNVGAMCSSTGARLVGAALISGSAELDLIFVAPGQVKIQTMTGSLGEVASTLTTLAVSAAGATYAAFGSVPFAGGHAPAMAFFVGASRILIFRITMTGLLLVADTFITGVSAATQLGGFADLNSDGYPEFVVSHDNFTVGVSSGVRSAIPLDLSAAGLSVLSPKAGFEHDS